MPDAFIALLLIRTLHVRTDTGTVCARPAKRGTWLRKFLRYCRQTSNHVERPALTLDSYEGIHDILVRRVIPYPMSLFKIIEAVEDCPKKAKSHHRARGFL